MTTGGGVRCVKHQVNIFNANGKIQARNAALKVTRSVGGEGGGQD